MKQGEFFMELGRYQAFKAYPASGEAQQMYFLIIKDSGIIKLSIGVSAAITLNSRVSGVSAAYVYDWLWNQGLSFLSDFEADYQTLLDRHEVENITIIIDEELVKSGEFSAPWEDLFVKHISK